MINCLLEIIDELHCLTVANPFENGRRMSSVLTIICFLDTITPKYLKRDEIPLDNISQLLFMLRLMPDFHPRKKCIDFDYVLSSIPEKYRVKVHESVTGFAVHFIHKRLLNAPEWLYCLPLVHFLSGKSSPFQELNCNPKDLQFVDMTFGFGNIKNKTRNKNYK